MYRRVKHYVPNHMLASKVTSITCLSKSYHILILKFISFHNIRPKVQLMSEATHSVKNVPKKQYKVKMPRTAMGHINFQQNSFKMYLHFIPNQIIKFQDSSLNTIRDILLIRSKCPELQRAIILSTFHTITLKSNKVIYTLSPISTQNFNTLA